MYLLDVPGPHSLCINLTWNMSTSMQNSEQFEYYLNLSELIISCINGILIFVGNGLTVSAIAKFKWIQSKTNMLLLSLSISDMCVGIFTIMKFILRQAGIELPYNYIPLSTLQSGSFACSSFHVTVIATERYIAIIHPLRYHDLISTRKLKMIIVIIWSVSFGITNLPIPLYIYKILSRNELEAYVLASLFTVGGGIVMYIYICILRVVRHQIRSINENGNSVGNGSTVCKTEKRATMTLGIIVMTYIISWTPNFILDLLRLTNTIPGSESVRIIHLTCFLIGYGNSAMNFFIYAAKSKEFQRAYTAIFTRTDDNTLVLSGSSSY